MWGWSSGPGHNPPRPSALGQSRQDERPAAHGWTAEDGACARAGHAQVAVAQSVCSVSVPVRRCGRREVGPAGEARTPRAGGSWWPGVLFLIICTQVPRVPQGTGCPLANLGPHQDMSPHSQPLPPSTSQFRDTWCRDCQSKSPCQEQGGSCLTPWGSGTWGAMGGGVRVGEPGVPGCPEHFRLSKPLAVQTPVVCVRRHRTLWKGHGPLAGFHRMQRPAV